MSKDSKRKAFMAWADEKLSPKTKALIRIALTDLYIGPGCGLLLWSKAEAPEDEEWVYEGCDNPKDYEVVGFETACKMLKQEYDLPSEVYYDRQFDQILEDLPEGEKDEETGEWIEADLSDIETINVKKERLGQLAPYV